MPDSTGQVKKSPRESFIYINDDQQVTAVRYANWKMGVPGAESAGHHAHLGRAFHETCASLNNSSTCEWTPTNAPTSRSNT